MKRRVLLVSSAAIAMLAASGSAQAATGPRALELVHSSYAVNAAKTLLAGDATSPGSNSTLYVDPAGDNEILAPDITNVTFSNDDLGTMGMRADTLTDPFLLYGTFFAVFLDTDQNPGTGNTGSDYAIAIDGATNTIGLALWNGSSWDFTVPQASLQGIWSFGPTITINRSDLANSLGMNFWIGSSWLSSYYDFAPDAGLPPWNYQVILGVPPPPPPQPQPPPPPPPPPPPTVRCRVPRVIGFTLVRAKRTIRARHCSVGSIRRVRSRRVGRVIGQRPGAGRSLPRGARVNLTVGRR